MPRERIAIGKKEQHEVGKYRITLLYTADGKVIGAIVEGPRISRPLYLAQQEEVRIKLPKQVAKFLIKHGFKITLEE